MAGEKYGPREAEYRPTTGARRCGNCVWLLDAATGARSREGHPNRCRVVSGGISWWWTCSLHTYWGEINRFFRQLRKLRLPCPP